MSLSLKLKRQVWRFAPHKANALAMEGAMEEVCPGEQRLGL